MENWGLIGFSAAMVLYDPVKTSDHLQQAVCETVTHELAHQVSQIYIRTDKKKTVRNEGYNLKLV